MGDIFSLRSSIPRVRAAIAALAALSLLVIAGDPLFAQGGYTAISLGNPPGATGFAAIALNNSEQCVGSATSSSFPTGHAFLNTDGTWTDIGYLNSNFANASAINDQGQVVGASGNYGNAFLWTSGTMIDLGTLGGNTSGANGINDSGAVVGEASTNYAPKGQEPEGPPHAFLWTSSGGMVDLGVLPGGSPSTEDSDALAINASGEVVGWAEGTAHTPAAFLWNGTMYDLGTLGGQISQANAINTNGQVAGFAATSNGTNQAFLWTPTQQNGTSGTMADIGPGGTTTTSLALGMNDSAEVVGYYVNGEGVQYAFVYSGGAAYNLTAMTSGLPENEVLHVANAINNAGWIVATGNDGTYLLKP